METPTAAFCGLWYLALASAEIQKSLLSWKVWEGHMQDSPAQDQLFVVLLMLSMAVGLSPHSQEGCGCTSESIPFCAMPLAQTALAKVTQSRGKRSLKYVLQAQRGQLSQPLSLLPSLSPLPPHPLAVSHGQWRVGTWAWRGAGKMEECEQTLTTDLGQKGLWARGGGSDVEW